MRWAPDARGRLQSAALELFVAQGYAATTVPEIARRAGLTTRTFFRYFADKREVIFNGDEIPETAARLIRTAPPGLDPMAVIRLVLHDVAGAQFAGAKAETAVWRRMIDGDDSLRDRDARKRADLVRAARSAFIDRGESELSATVFAEAGALIFHVALEEWIRSAGPTSLAEVIDDVSTLLQVTPEPTS